MLNKLKIFDLSYFVDKSCFDEDDTQRYLVFQPLFSYFKLNTKAAGAISPGNLGDYLMNLLRHLLHQILAL